MTPTCLHVWCVDAHSNTGTRTNTRTRTNTQALMCNGKVLRAHWTSNYWWRKRAMIACVSWTLLLKIDTASPAFHMKHIRFHVSERESFSAWI